MRNKIILLLFFFFSLTNLFGQLENRITERIIYTVRFDDKTKKEGGFYSHLDSVTKTKLINQICDLVYTKKLKAQNYWGDEVGQLPSGNVLGDHLLESYFGWSDTMRYHPDKPKNKNDWDVKRDNRVYRYLINSLSFQEQWYFDSKKNIFTKKVRGVILFEDKYTHNIGMTENNYVTLNDSSANEYDPKYLIAKNIIYDVPVTRSETENCNDYNWWHNYLEASKREKLFDILTNEALYDSISPTPVFKPIYPYDSLIPRSHFINEGLSDIYYGRSNWEGTDPLMVGMTDEKILAASFELADWTTVTKIRFHEEWYFDSRKYTFEKKVLGIGLIVDTYNEKGKVNGEKCLVYLKLNAK